MKTSTSHLVRCGLAGAFLAGAAALSHAQSMPPNSGGRNALPPSVEPDTPDRTVNPPRRPVSADANRDPAAGESKLDRADERFLNRATESNHEQLEMSRLASERAANYNLRNYAQKIVDGYEQMANELATLVATKGVELAAEQHSNAALNPDAVSPSSNDVPSGPATNRSSAAAPRNPAAAITPAEQRQEKKLEERSGADFDRAFLKRLVRDQQDSIKRFEKEAKDGHDADLQAFATKHLPTLRADLAEAEPLKKSVE